jgi:chitin disaccharide deacetylase
MSVSSNPLLKKLGFSPTDRVVIIHTDDIGLTQASVSAAKDLWAFGVITSSAVMVPCPWFPLTAQLCRETPQIDMGVHITLTSEWDEMRWGPISTRDPASGLMDSEGYFYRSTHEAREHANIDAAAREMTMQVERALAAGIDVTHIDTHMGTVISQQLLPVYAQVALRFRIPAFIPRYSEQSLRAKGYGAEESVFFARATQMFESAGLPLIDDMIGMPLDKPANRLAQLHAALDSVPAGITHFIIHPSHDTPEARATNPDLASRAGDYETLMDERTRAHIKASGLHTIGYRALREVMGHTLST